MADEKHSISTEQPVVLGDLAEDVARNFTQHDQRDVRTSDG